MRLTGDGSCPHEAEMHGVSLSYVARLLNQAQQRELVRLASPAQAQQWLQAMLAEDGENLLIGTSSDAWVLAAVLEYAHRRGAIPFKGSHLGRRLSEWLDELELLIPAREGRRIRIRLAALQRSPDANLVLRLRQIHQEQGKPEYAADVQEYIRDYQAALAQLQALLFQAEQRGLALVVLVPH